MNLALILLAAVPTETLSGDALMRYQDAVQKVQIGQHGDATNELNVLAGDHPRVAEIFATRCSAQLGLNHLSAAEADCDYALKVKPTLSSALYGLAVAEDREGKAPQAVELYRRYASLTDAPPSLKQQALARADALSAPQQLVVPPPPPPGATVVAPPAPATATLFIYRNHYFQGSNQQVTLLIDDKVVGDIGHDQYVELVVTPGEHIVEADIGGVRYYRPRGPTLEINTANGVFDARVGEAKGERVIGMQVPVTLVAGGRNYVNFDTQAGELMLMNVPADRGADEMRHDCTKAYGRKM
jgi:hypothetical protein